ncbi:MAG: hypothetical protein AB1938_14035 [Myxococcota bacterium]
MSAPARCATVLALALALTAHAQPRRVEVRVAPGVLWLGGTPYLHGFHTSTQLDAVAPRLLFSLSADVATFDGWWGITWLGLTWALATPWDVTVVDKHEGAPPRRLDTATVHLLVVEGPAPRFRWRAPSFTLFGQTTLGVRTGVVLQQGFATSPIELMWCLTAGLDVPLTPHRAVGVSVEVLHSLATGWVTGLAALHFRGWY